ncbi:MAG TPA: helix-turn-helix transcriptional regulator [Rhodocyclaceae bacterium]|nr:helix-turn-helix transcriptional regulator [Rhodocyclaceae bacterium]
MSTIVYMPTFRRSNQIVPGLPQRLRSERERLGMSQEFFANQVGVTRVTQNYYENGVRDPSLNYISACGAIGVDISFLLHAEAHGVEHAELLDWELFGKVWDWVRRVAVDSKGRAYSNEIQKKAFQLAYQALRKKRIADLEETDLTLILSMAA